MRLFILLIAFFYTTFCYSQNSSLEEFGKEIFSLMQEDNYAKLLEKTVDKNDVFLDEEIIKMTPDKKGEFLKYQREKAYSRIVDINKSVYRKGIDWRKTTITNVYKIPATKGKSYPERILIVFQDWHKLDFLMEIYAIKIRNGYKLIDKGMSIGLFSDETNAFLKEKGISNHIEEVRKDEKLAFNTQLPVIDSVTDENRKYILKIYSRYGVKSYKYSKDKTNDFTYTLTYFSDGKVKDSIFEDKDKGTEGTYSYSDLGKLSFSKVREGNTITQKKYHLNGLLEQESEIIDGKKEGVHSSYYYTGQLIEKINYVNDFPVGLVTRYSVLGDVVSEKKYSSYENVQTLEDLKYFIPFEVAYRYYSKNYEGNVLLFRKPSGWYVVKFSEKESEHLLWSFKEQSFKSLAGFKQLSYGKSHYYKEMEKYYKPRTLFSDYNGWSEDVIKLLENSSILPDSLHESLCTAYYEQIKLGLLSNNAEIVELNYSKVLKFPKSAFIRGAEALQNYESYNSIMLALVAKSINNIKDYNRFLSQVNFTEGLRLHAKRTLNECDRGAFLISQNDLLLSGIQMKENYRTDVSILDKNLVYNKWYRNLLRTRLNLEFLVPDEQYEKIRYIEFDYHEKEKKNILLKDFLYLIKNRVDYNPTLSLPYSISNLDLKISNKEYYRLNTYSSYGIYNVAKIAEMDAMQNYIIKNPKLPIFYEQSFIETSYSNDGFLVNKLVLYDSINKPSKLWENPAEKALEIKSINEIDSSYYNYYAYKFSSLISRYSKIEEKEVARRILIRYMELFGKLTSPVDLMLRTEVIQSAWRLGNNKLANEYMSATLKLIETPNKYFTKEDISLFNSRMIDFYSFGMDENLKNYYPEEYKKKEKQKHLNTGSGGDMSIEGMDTIAAPER